MILSRNMISKGLLLTSIIIPVILGLLFLASNTIDNTSDLNNRIDIQLIREEMKLVSFGVTENIGADRRDVLFINNDGSILFSPELGYGEQERGNISINNLKIIKSFITNSGLLFINEEEFRPEQLPERFVRYTLTINIDSNNKRFQWIESNNEFDPSNTPPLLIKLKDMIYCMTDKAELYGIRCS